MIYIYLTYPTTLKFISLTAILCVPLAIVLQNILKVSKEAPDFPMDPKLYEAAMNGDLVYLQTLQETSDILHSLRTPSQDTVLHVAAEFHRTAFAKAAVRDCPSLLWQANAAGDTALHIAAGENNTDMVEFLIDRARRADVETGEPEHLKELLRMVNLEKDTALHCAARRGSFKCVELLVQADPEVCSFVNKADESPLYLSVASGYWNMPQIILTCAASSASHKGPNGLTALHPTIFFSNYAREKVELLVRWRREMIREKDNLGLTPLHYAALYGSCKVTSLILQYDSFAVYLLSDSGEYALHVAAFCGNIKILDDIVCCRPDCWNLIDNKGRTALHAAVLGNQQEVVKFMLGTPRLAGLINKQDKDGNTALHLAAQLKLYGVIEILAKSKKVSLKIANKEFLTPLEVYNKHKEEGLRAAVSRSNLKGSKNTMAMQRFATKQLAKMNKLEAANAKEETSTNSNVKKKSNFEVQNALEVNLLVATLVATVTFAAGFTVPGGYVNNGEDEGLAIHTKKALFQVFIVFNTLAFCCSIFAVLLQFHTSLADYHLRVRYMGIAAFSTTIAILAMALAFSSGTYVVLTKSTGLSVTPYIICGCFGVVYFVIPLADPGVEGFPCLDRPQKFVRGIIIRYIRCGVMSNSIN